MLTRREFLIRAAAVGAVMLIPGRVWARSPRAEAARNLRWLAHPDGTLRPTDIPKYVTPLVIPPAMPRTVRPGVPRNVDYYEIAVRQFQQQILPPGMPMTTVWSYGSVQHPGSFHAPAFTIEANYRRPVRVKWINDLKDETGRFLPHLLPVDPTLHWANPPGGNDGRDSRPVFTSTPDPYTGPVPIVTHLHGGHTTQESDGFPEAWYLPAATNIPAGFATTGTYYDIFQASSPDGADWEPGAAVFQYANDQRAATLWYHDHSLGITRLNVYAGPAGFYLLRRGPGDLPTAVLPGPAPALGDPPGTRYYEIPIAIQDRTFNTDGSLFYPSSREFFDEFAGPYVPASDVPPIWNPEFFGNTIMVNGRTWPYLEVEARRYRFRFLNGCNSRFLILTFSDPDLTFWQIGSDGGFLPAPVPLKRLLLGPAERADVIVDFSEVRPGTQILLRNLGPDEPFSEVPDPDAESDVADPETTGQVMQFRVVAPTGKDRSRSPDRLHLPAFRPLGQATAVRQVSLNEEFSTLGDFPIAALLGTMAEGNPVAKGWDDPITENPARGTTESWELFNFTGDAHPIHIHMVQFQVVERQPIDGGPARPPEPWEHGFKDTVISFPGEITRVKALFDLAGLFVWHCHILEHEDNEMMRPYRVT